MGILTNDEDGSLTFIGKIKAGAEHMFGYLKYAAIGAALFGVPALALSAIPFVGGAVPVMTLAKAGAALIGGIPFISSIFSLGGAIEKADEASRAEHHSIAMAQGLRGRGAEAVARAGGNGETLSPGSLPLGRGGRAAEVG